jgi:large subunit ribosomal protein L5
MARRAIGGQGGGRRPRQGVRKAHIRRGDRVRVIRGNFAGLDGTVLRVIPSENRVVVEGVNLRKRHMRPSQSNPEGGIMTYEAPIHASNVMLIDPTDDEPTRYRRKRGGTNPACVGTYGQRDSEGGDMKPRLQAHYEDRVSNRLREELEIANEMRIPRITKVVVNVGVGEASRNPKLLDSVVEEVGQITGQRPVVTRARKSIANFNLREGMPVGVKVTLRGARMYEFLDRLINVAVPRIRDFRGLPSRAFDGRGNYTFGIREQMIFPEIDYDKVNEIHGMDIVIVTSTDKDDEAFALLREMGMPFRGATPVSIEADEAAAVAG